MSRIVHITNKHAATSIRIFGKECRSLAAAGYDVHLLAPDPPADELDGVRFHAIPAYRAFKRHPLGTFADQRAIRRLCLELNADLYQFHDPELIPLGVALAKRGRRVVYDVHEDFPNEAIALNPDRPLYGRLKALAWRGLERRARRYLAGFACATPDIAGNFPADRTELVRNFPRLAEFMPERAIPYDQRPRRLCYVGILSPIRGIGEMLGAVDRLADVEGLQLAVGGRFVPEDYGGEVRAMPGWNRVDFRGWLDREGVADLLGSSRVGLVLLHPTPTHLTSYPVKLFEYMAMGLPVVASDFPLWRRIVEDAGCGLLADPTDPAAVAAQIRWLLEHPDQAEAMGRAGRAAAEATYSWDSEADRLTAFYERLLAAP